MEITTEMIQNVMGKSMTEIADIFFEGYDLEKRRELLEYCCEEENNYILSHGGKLLEGLEETLKTLQQQGYFLYIVSNCQVGYIEAFWNTTSWGSILTTTCPSVKPGGTRGTISD